jgi:hypothetical protein
MNAATRLSVYAGLVTLAWLGLWASCPGLFAGSEQPGAGGREAEAVTQADEREAQELERASEAVRRRLATRQCIASDLAAGRLTLHQAAARFEVLNHESAACQEAVRWSFPGRSTEEQTCRQVIAWTQGVVARQSSARAEAVTRSLNAELERKLRSSH